MDNATNVNSERTELTVEYMNEHIEQSITMLGQALNDIHPLVLRHQLHLVKMGNIRESLSTTNLSKQTTEY